MKRKFVKWIFLGVCHNNIQISCLDCSADTGKIAAAYDDQVIIFEPTPLISQQSKNSNNSNDGGNGKESKSLNYWWVETARIKAECNVSTLAWNNDATRFFTAGEFLQLWQHEIKQGKLCKKKFVKSIFEKKIRYKLIFPNSTEKQVLYHGYFSNSFEKITFYTEILT